MTDKNDKNDNDEVVYMVGESTPDFGAAVFKGDPAHASRKLLAAKNLREATLERMGQVSMYRTFLDYLQVFERAQAAYWLAFGRDWRPERDEGHLEVFLFVEQIYCELLYYTSVIQKDAEEVMSVE